jgi:hypothetical protein
MRDLIHRVARLGELFRNDNRISLLRRTVADQGSRVKVETDLYDDLVALAILFWLTSRGPPFGDDGSNVGLLDRSDDVPRRLVWVGHDDRSELDVNETTGTSLAIRAPRQKR